MKRIFFIVFQLSFIQLFALDYYWVGGTGNWSDINHWATTSGGTILHTTVPSSTDDVYFDVNSFNSPNSIVTLDVQNAFCRDLNWTGATNNPSFESQNQNPNTSEVLRIFGDLIFISAMQVLIHKIEFEGLANGPKNIITGNHFIHFVTLKEIGQQWQLNDSLKCFQIKIDNGELKTNNQTVLAERYYQISQNTNAFFDSSLVILSGGSIRFEPKNYPFDAGESTIIFKASSNIQNNFINASFKKFSTVVFEDSLGNHNAGYNNNFSNLICKGDLQIQNDTIDSLFINQGKKISVFGQVSAIIDYWNYNGSCNIPIYIEGEVNNNPTLHFSSGSVTLNYLSTKNMTYTGGPWVANNSFDLGNNAGITINQPPISSLYWVGGTGNWSDVNHWAFTSGGIGGACLPNSRTNVIFDVNSFTGITDTITIDLKDAFCRDFNWNPNIASNPLIENKIQNQNLHINGDFILFSGLQNSFNGALWFESDTLGNIINTNNIQIPGNIYFNNSNGEWNLQNHFETTNYSYFIYNRAGYLKTKGYNVNVSRILTYYPQLPNSVRKFNFSTSAININSNWSELQYTDSSQIKADSVNFFLHGNSRIRFGKSFINSVEVIDTLNDNIIEGGHFIKQILRGLIYHNCYSIDSLILKPGASIQVNNASIILKILEYLEAAAPCFNPISFFTHFPSNGYINISSSASIITNNFNVMGIKNQGNLTSLVNSFDLGGNTGFNFSTNTPRKLYWVGNGGNWFNDTCWSLSSGGLGGNCIPTSIDTVIIDQNSFSAPNQTITHDNKTIMVKAFFWQNTPPNTNISPGGNIWIFGMHKMDNSTGAFFQNTFWYKTKDATDTCVVSLKNNNLNLMHISGSGKFIFSDSIRFQRIRLYQGALEFDSTYLEGWIFETPNAQDSASLFLNNAFFKGGRFYCEKNKFHLLDSNSTIQLTERFRISTPNLTFNKIVISGQPAWSQSDFLTNKGRINKAEFYYNTNIFGKTEFNSLFLDDNNLYQFQHADTQRIHRLEAMWNPCFPITIRSTQQGTQAHWLLPTDSVATDFMEIRDLNNAGPEPFYAGDAGINQGNNSGIFFYRAPGFIYGFHDDTIMLACDPINFQYELRTNTFQRADSFLWFNGSTDTSFFVTQSDTIRVSAFYGTCEVKDTVAIYLDTLVTTNTPLGALNDTVLCWHDSLVTSIHKDTLNYTFQWNTGSQNQLTTYYPDTSGYLVGIVTNGGQTCYDSTYIYLNNPTLEIADDSILCSGLDSVSINAPPYTAYQWATGDSAQNIKLFQSGIFWLKIIDSIGCYQTDTFEVFSPSAITYSQQIDTIFCEGDLGGIAVNPQGGTGQLLFTFEDSSVTNLTVDSLNFGVYTFKIEDQNGCFVVDSVELPAPDSLGIRITQSNPTCFGFSDGFVDITPYGGNGNYVIDWQQLPDSFVLSQIDSGRYYFTIYDAKGCTYEDSISFSHPQKINIALTLPDTVCENDNIWVKPEIENGQGLISSQINGVTFQDSVSITIFSDSTLQVFATDSAGCFSDTILKTISIIPELELLAPDSIVLCGGRVVELKAEVKGTSNTNYHLLWPNGDRTGLERSFAPTANQYIVSLEEACNNKGIDTIMVEYFESPSLDFDVDLGLSCEGITLNFENLSVNTTNEYWLYKGELINESSPNIIFPLRGNKSLTLIGENEYCADSLEVNYKNLNIDSLIRSYIPNVFTPNGDGFNDEFATDINEILPCCQLEIFSRWGNSVYNTKRANKPWNGRIQNNGEKLRNGVYFYVLKFDEFVFKGEVTLNQ